MVNRKAFVGRLLSRLPESLFGLAVMLVYDSNAWAYKSAPLALSDLKQLEAISGDVSLSPDSRYAAIENNGAVTVIDVQSQGTVAKLGDAALPIWSPIGRVLAFYSARSGQRQLWTWHMGGEGPRQVTRFADGIDPDPTTRIAGSVADAFRYSWSSDGRYIAFPSRVVMKSGLESPAHGAPDFNPGEDKPLVLDDTSPPGWTLAGVFANPTPDDGVAESKTGHDWSVRKAELSQSLFNQLFVVDVTDGQLRQLTNARAESFNPSWRPDGKALVFAEVADTPVRYSTSSGRLVLIDFSNGLQRILADGTRIKFQPKWSPDGTRIAFKSAESVFGRPRIDLIDVKRDYGISAGPYFDRYITEYEWTPHSVGLIVSFKDGVSSRLARIGAQSGEVSYITQSGRLPFAIDSFSQSTNGAIAWRQIDPQDLSTVRYIRKPSGKQNILWRSQLKPANHELGHVEIVAWRSRRGDSMEGTVMFPPDYDASRRYPLIVDAYPNAGGADWSSPNGGNFAWASMGYVVFRPSPTAPHVWMNPWKGYDASGAARGARGWNLTFDDVISGVDYLIDRGIANGSRMCLFGYSNGGGVVTNLITRTSRFRCAVILAPALADWVRPALLYSSDIVAAFAGAELEQGLDDYIALSSVYHLSTIETPVLIAAGDKDHDGLMDSIEIYNRLRVMHKTVTFLRYPSQDHVFDGVSQQDLWSRELDFFSQYLLH